MALVGEKGDLQENEQGKGKGRRGRMERRDERKKGCL
jgi:hypothetical protein